MEKYEVVIDKYIYQALRDSIVLIRDKKQERLKILPTLDINLMNATEAKEVGRENEFWSAYADAYRLFLYTLPGEPKKGNILYDDIILEMEGFDPEVNMTPLDIYVLCDIYKDSNYEDLKKKTDDYKKIKKAYK